MIYRWSCMICWHHHEEEAVALELLSVIFQEESCEGSTFPLEELQALHWDFPLNLEGELGRCRIIYQYITCGQSLIWCSGTLKEYGWKLMARKMLVSLSNGQKKHEDISALCAYQKMWPQQERILSSSDEVTETSQSFSGNLWHHSMGS